MIFLILNPPTNYILTLIKPFSFVWYVIPLLKTGALASTCDLFVQVDDDKTQKKPSGRLDQLQLLATILAQWRRLVASNKALYLLYWVMRYCTSAPPWPSKRPVFLVIFFAVVLFAVCCPGGCWGNTDWVVAQCQRPVASGIALDMLHWVMHFVSHRRTAMAIETANDRGTSWCNC